MQCVHAWGMVRGFVRVDWSGLDWSGLAYFVLRGILWKYVRTVSFLWYSVLEN